MDEFIKALASGAGVAGIILGWHLFKTDGRLKAIEDALNVLAKADLVRLIASPHVAAEIKEEVTKLLREVEKQEKK